MKTKIAIGLVSLTLFGCAAGVEQRNAEKQKAYSELTKCENIGGENSISTSDRASFAKALKSEAAITSLEKSTIKYKLDTLQIIGWDNSVADAVADCAIKKKEYRISIMNKAFKDMRDKTGDTEEKKALIAAYSAWEVYLGSSSKESEQDFDNKVSYYKNM